MFTIEQLKNFVDGALRVEKRSVEYTNGVLHELEYRFGLRDSMEFPVICTAQYDAYCSGIDRGRALYEKIKPIY